MPMPRELDHCPRTPECVQRKIYQDDDGKLWRYDMNAGKFKAHTCTAMGTESTLPAYIYCGEWKNRRTGRTRYVGPVRLKSSAMNPPADQKKRANEWTLVQVHVVRPDWKPVED